MLLKDRFVAHGSFLFRWRSYLPLLLLLPVLLAIPDSGHLERWFGERAEDAWRVFCVFIAFTGLAVRVATVGFVPAGTSGRHTQTQCARVLNTTGLYSVVRNPLYLGNLITIFGLALSVEVWWLVLVVGACALLYYERVIYAEESYLHAKFGAAYEAWAARTPALVPDLRRWRRPELPFSVRSALRREYHGFYLIVVATVLIELVADMIGEGRSFSGWVREDYGWIVFLALGSIIYLALRVIRKRTTWLVVPGR